VISPVQADADARSGAAGEGSRQGGPGNILGRPWLHYGVPQAPQSLQRRDFVVVAVIIALSATAQTLAAIYFGSRESLMALGGSALAFLTWVVVRFR